MHHYLFLGKSQTLLAFFTHHWEKYPVKYKKMFFFLPSGTICSSLQSPVAICEEEIVEQSLTTQDGSPTASPPTTVRLLAASRTSSNQETLQAYFQGSYTFLLLRHRCNRYWRLNPSLTNIFKTLWESNSSAILTRKLTSWVPQQPS